VEVNEENRTWEGGGWTELVPGIQWIRQRKGIRFHGFKKKVGNTREKERQDY